MNSVFSSWFDGHIYGNIEKVWKPGWHVFKYYL